MAADKKDVVLELRQIVRGFGLGETRIDVLKGVGLRLVRGEVAALLGPSGSGKSTLLHIAGLLEKPESGDVVIHGKVCTTMSDAQRTAMRRKELGFVYQFHHLLPEFSALENVALPQMIAGKGRRKAEAEAAQQLEDLGLGGRLAHQPMQLSGGEQQRVAIARALANSPSVLLADEPTGNLDPKTAHAVFESLLALVRGTGLAALIATHNFELARTMDRVLRLEDGFLTESSVAAL